MFKILIYILFFTLGALTSTFYSCTSTSTDCKYSDYLLCNGGSVAPKLIWSKQVSDPEAGVTVYPGGSGFPYNDDIVAVGYAKDPSIVGFMGLELSTGRQLWETPLSSGLSTTAAFVMLGKNVILPISSHRFQQMDVTTGAIVEDKTLSGYYWEDIQKLGDRLVYVGITTNNKGSDDEHFFQSSTDAPFDMSVLLPPNKHNDFSRGAGQISTIIQNSTYQLFVGKGKYEGDTLLLFHQGEPMFDGAEPNTDYYNSNNLYNISKREWVYRFKEGPNPLCIDEESGRMYMSYWDSYNYRDRDNPKIHNKVYMYDLYTGEEMKSIPYSDYYPPKTAVVWNDILLICQNSGNTTAMDKNSGQVLWSKDFSGMNEFDFQILNGVLYFTTSYLVAVDIKTGELLWNIRSPNADRSSQKFGSPYFFSSYLQAIPGKNGEKGKIVAYDYLNAYCYEAIR